MKTPGAQKTGPHLSLCPTSEAAARFPPSAVTGLVVTLSPVHEPQNQSKNQNSTNQNIYIYFALISSVVSDCHPMHESLPVYSLWNFSGKNTGMSCHFLLQGIFLTQRLNLCLLNLLPCRWIAAIRKDPYHIYGYVL